MYSQTTPENVWHLSRFSVVLSCRELLLLKFHSHLSAAISVNAAHENDRKYRAKVNPFTAEAILQLEAVL